MHVQSQTMPIDEPSPEADDVFQPGKLLTFVMQHCSGIPEASGMVPHQAARIGTSPASPGSARSAFTCRTCSSMLGLRSDASASMHMHDPFLMLRKAFLQAPCSSAEDLSGQNHTDLSSSCVVLSMLGSPALHLLASEGHSDVAGSRFLPYAGAASPA